jgi:hypothetical protein
VRLESALDNDWLGIQGDLVNDATGEVVSFYEELSFYSGRDSDGAWTEGSREGTARLGRLEPGRYVLRTTASFDLTKGPRERSFRVRVVDDPPPSGTLFLVFLGLLLVPVGFAVHGANTFETRRWAESNLQEGG